VGLGVVVFSSVAGDRSSNVGEAVTTGVLFVDRGVGLGVVVFSSVAGDRSSNVGEAVTTGVLFVDRGVGLGVVVLSSVAGDRSSKVGFKVVLMVGVDVVVSVGDAVTLPFVGEELGSILFCLPLLGIDVGNSTFTVTDGMAVLSIDGLEEADVGPPLILDAAS
jgi:hypothetical protein